MPINWATNSWPRGIWSRVEERKMRIDAECPFSAMAEQQSYTRMGSRSGFDLSSCWQLVPHPYTIHASTRGGRIGLQPHSPRLYRPSMRLFHGVSRPAAPSSKAMRCSRCASFCFQNSTRTGPSQTWGHQKSVQQRRRAQSGIYDRRGPRLLSLVARTSRSLDAKFRSRAAPGSHPHRVPKNWPRLGGAFSGRA
jgi:hypothetical protein